MATKCPKCNADNPDTLKFCGECATPLPSKEEISISHTKTLQVPIQDLFPSEVFAGRYQVIEELGKGGMGRVYKVMDTQINEEMALKLLKPEIASDEGMIERFRNELKIARKITHKNVCRMHDINEEEGTPYITMEYVEGEDLKSLMRSKGKLTEEDAISIAKQICEGLTEAHELGVVHRDLKPQNTMIDEKGRVRIMDFGIARSVEAPGVTQTGMIIGTPDYISPEQAEGVEADERSDIYSLGVILYEMITGSVPFRGDTALSVAIKHKTQLPSDPRKLNPEVSDDLCRLILICMEKDRKRRYQTATELLEDLRNIEEGFPLGTKIQPRRETFVSSLVRKKFFIPALVVVLAIIAVVIWQVLLQKELVPSASSSKPSIAVLPFDDLSPQKDLGYLCDGLPEIFIAALSQIKNLHVPAKTSAFSFKSRVKNYQEIGGKLNVEAVLEGSIQKAGNVLRITARIITTSDGSLLWSDTYDGEEKDIFDIQDQISMEIVDNLNLELIGGEKAGLMKRYTDDSEAYNLYLKGQFFWEKFTEESMKKGLEYFEQAIEKDPNFALAYAGLAQCYGLLGLWGYYPPRSVWPKAKTEVKKAMELDDTLAEVHATLSFISLYYDWDWPAFEKHIKRAIELAPGYAEPHFWNADYLRYMGRFDEAIEEMKRALELDPLFIMLHNLYGNILDHSGRRDDAIEQIQKTLEMDPNFGLAHGFIGVAYNRQGRYKEAIAAFEKANKLLGDRPVMNGRIGAAYAKSGQREKAMNVLRELEERSKQQYIPKTRIAVIYVALGEIDKALELLEKAYEERDNMLLAFDFKTIPYLDSIHLDSRFIALRKKMGLK